MTAEDRSEDWRLNGEQLALKRARAAEQQRDRLLGAISAHEAKEAHGPTARRVMEHADDELYAAADAVEGERDA